MPSQGPADLVISGGRIWTGGTDHQPSVDAIAIRDGRIVAVGREPELRTHISPRTERISIGDGVLLPAFQDAHCHPLWGGLTTLECDLSEGRTPEHWLSMIADYAADHPELPVISGEGWSPYPFTDGLPHRRLLDELVPDRPVVVGSFDGHSTWCNSAALRLAGIDAGTVDPPRGRIERDAKGEPIGVFHEAARALVERIKPAPTDATLREALRRGQAYLHSLGISAWLDAIVDPGDERTYLSLADAGELTGRVSFALRWDADRGLEQIDELKDRRRDLESRRGGLLRPIAVKLFADGVIESSTAALLDPYADLSATDPRSCGASVYETRELRRICTAVDAAGFEVQAHAIGDRAVRDVLDALDAARSANGVRDSRHAIAHLELVDEADIPRFAALDVIADCQPLWAVHDETDQIVGRRLDTSRLERRYPFGRLRDADAALAMGSDWNVSTADPLQIMHVAVTRTPPRSTGIPPLGEPGERLTLDEALRAYTLGSARVLRLERDSGTIAVGKAADLVMLADDPFRPGTDLLDCTVNMTLVAGRPVYSV
jgi:predicted amidohydrolase YtcJ